MKNTFFKSLTIIVLCFVVQGLSSCIPFTGQHFRHMGEEGQCILIQERTEDAPELYRAGDKLYVKGTLTDFRQYNPQWSESIDRTAPDYSVTLPSAPRQTVYLALTPRRRATVNRGVYLHDYVVETSPILTELPANATRYDRRIKFDSLSDLVHIKDKGNWRNAIVTQELEANLHALYAYPLAALCYVGIDTPIIVLQSGAVIVSLPFIYCYDSIARYCELSRQSND